MQPLNSINNITFKSQESREIKVIYQDSITKTLVEHDIKENVDEFVQSFIKGANNDIPLKTGFCSHPAAMLKTLSTRIGQLTTNKQKQLFSNLDKFINSENIKGAPSYAESIKKFMGFQIFQSPYINNDNAVEYYAGKLKELAQKSDFDIRKLLKI